jgi:hypothetical protein
MPLARYTKEMRIAVERLFSEETQRTRRRTNTLSNPSFLCALCASAVIFGPRNEVPSTMTLLDSSCEE